MNYIHLYQKIVDRGKRRSKSDPIYLEKHHIVPKCLGGANSKENLTLLTGREHFIVHWMLCKIHKNEPDIIHKLAAAFNMMCKKNLKLGTSKRRITSHQYQQARRCFAEFHPMKSETVRNKVREAHAKRSVIIQQLNEECLPLCACGCGTKVKHKKSKYIQSHFLANIAPKMAHTEQAEQKRSKSAKRFINTLSVEDRQKRLKNSLHGTGVDHVKRGHKISLSKKGVKTNQQHITGSRYALMSDLEFGDFLLTISPKAKKRAVNLRNKYARN
jgi:hypothetical protein